MNTTTTKHQLEQTYILLSKKGMKELKKAISQLEHDLLAIQRSIRESDRSSTRDNRYEQNERLSQLEAIESELAEKQSILSRAKLIPSKRASVRVAIGSVVDLIDQQGRLFRYTLVNSVEANPSDGRISTESPLGSSLIGKTVTDTVAWNQSSKSQNLRLVRIT